MPSYPAAAPPPGRPEVLFAARMHPRKRPVAFVEMAKKLLDAGVDARFTLVGHDEGEGPALRAALKGDPRITWEGALTPDAIPGSDGCRGRLCAPFGPRAAPYVGAGSDVGWPARRRHQRLWTGAR